MNQINDIYNNLDENIDINDSLILSVEKLGKNNSNDINNNNNNKTISFKSEKNIKIIKNKTNKFDNIQQKHEKTDINLIKKQDGENIFHFIIRNKNILKKRIILTQNKLKIFLIILLGLSFLIYIDKLLVEHFIKSGYNKIIYIKNDIKNINYINKKINSAKFDFIVGKILFYPFNIINNKNIENGHYIIEGGLKLTKFLDNSLTLGTKIINFIDKKGGIENIKISNLILNLKEDISLNNELLYEVLVSYSKIGDLGDSYLNNKLSTAIKDIKFIYLKNNIINQNLNTFLDIIGHKKEKKYLIVFQNNDEIRATGGFIGSIALISIKNGKITTIKNDDIYALEWQINKVFKKKEKAPKGLNKITGTFGLRDANYFPEIKDSSNKIKFFLDKINYKIDGIIYINQNIILDFLETTGNIYFDKIDQNINKENFSMIISTLVEAKVFKIGTLGTPKQILFDFAELFKQKLKKNKKYSEYLNILIKNIESRDIVFYSFNSVENSLLWKLGLNGDINFGKTIDFNYPIYTSIGGNKSDRYIKLNYKKEIIQNKDCSIKTIFSINRFHSFTNNKKNEVIKLLNSFGVKNKKDIINIQGLGDNKSFTRIIIPKDTILLNKNKNYTLKEYKKYNIIELYQTTRPSEFTTDTIEYLIPNFECKPYSYTLYKQAGIKEYNIEFNNGYNIIKNIQLNKDFIYK